MTRRALGGAAAAAALGSAAYWFAAYWALSGGAGTPPVEGFSPYTVSAADPIPFPVPADFYLNAQKLTNLTTLDGAVPSAVIAAGEPMHVARVDLPAGRPPRGSRDLHPADLVFGLAGVLEYPPPTDGIDWSDPKQLPRQRPVNLMPMWSTRDRKFLPASANPEPGSAYVDRLAPLPPGRYVLQSAARCIDFRTGRRRLITPFVAMFEVAPKGGH